MTDALNQVDVCFVVDTTGSMGPFLQTAKQHLHRTMEALRIDNDLDLRVGLVEYRDHPPQDNSFVTRFHAPGANLRAMQGVINGLVADGGGDAPEAVYDGVHEGCLQMPWRRHSCRFILLVGDAPPHGIRAHEHPAEEEGEEATETRGRRAGARHRDICPCGLTVHTVTAAAESRNVTVHALCMVGDPATVAAFGAIASGTGGQCAPAQSVDRIVETMVRVLQREFQNMDFDRRTLAVVGERRDLDTAAIAEALGCPRMEAAASLARLGKRGFLDEFITLPAVPMDELAAAGT